MYEIMKYRHVLFLKYLIQYYYKKHLSFIYNCILKNKKDGVALLHSNL